MNEDLPRREGQLWWSAIAVLFAVGLYFRFHDVTEQVLGGDEYHSIRVARQHGLVESFTHYESAENSIPFTL